ncbi:MAG: hypothetical protein KDF54_15785 [Hydrogenophaga sp.]|nr:hypothetical protein [Hydrogenophaga sp.]
MNLNRYAFRSAHDDPLVINDATRHQYYSTMQAEVYNEDLLLDALNKRQARAMLERQDLRRLKVVLAVAVACAAAGLIWALT